MAEPHASEDEALAARGEMNGSRSAIVGSHARVALGALAALGAALVLFFWSSIEDSAIERLVLPRYETAYGFRGGRLPVRRSNERHDVYGFVAVTPGGRLDRAGVRPGDIPTLSGLRAALSTVERGHAGTFTVLTPSDWPNEASGRRITVDALTRAAVPT